MLNTARVTIDPAALRHNLAVVRELCPHSRILAMIKADAYGHGLLPAAHALAAADGLAVARLDEALQLRRAGIGQRLMLLGTLLDADDLRRCSEQDIDVTAHDTVSVAAIAAAARSDPLRVWLKLDSGMHRLGLMPDEFTAADRLLRTHPGVRELLHWTHLSDAENLHTAISDRQLAVLRAAHAESRCGISIANSAAVIARPDTHATWVRPGIMLYGMNPLQASHVLPLRPAMTLCANVIAIRHITAGEAVGYNRTWTAARDSVIATLGIGYGDGYPRHARNGTPVWLGDRKMALAGRVSMDSITVDVTDHPAVCVGDEAELWGEHLSAEEVAGWADTISYELFTGVTARVARSYSN